MTARQCNCETPVIDWESPYCDGTCRRCAGDLGHTLTARDELQERADATYAAQRDADLAAEAAERRYTVIESTPGYLPDDDDPATFEDRGEAQDYMMELVRTLNDSIIEGGGHPDVCHGDSWARVEDGTRPHDLGRYFEVVECEES